MQIEMEKKIVEVLAKLRAQAAARRMPLDASWNNSSSPMSRR